MSVVRFKRKVLRVAYALCKRGKKNPSAFHAASALLYWLPRDRMVTEDLLGEAERELARLS